MLDPRIRLVTPAHTGYTQAMQFDGTEECAKDIVAWADGGPVHYARPPFQTDGSIVIEYGEKPEARKGDWIVRDFDGTYNSYNSENLREYWILPPISRPCVKCEVRPVHGEYLCSFNLCEECCFGAYNGLTTQ